jgi:hypothetical protein
MVAETCSKGMSVHAVSISITASSLNRTDECSRTVPLLAEQQYIYIYIYIYVCVCVCVCVYTYIYIYNKHSDLPPTEVLTGKLQNMPEVSACLYCYVSAQLQRWRCYSSINPSATWCWSIQFSVSFCNIESSSEYNLLTPVFLHILLCIRSGYKKL